MKTEEIIKEIHDYFNNTVLFLPEKSASGGLTITQLQKEIRIDILNECPEDKKDVRVFPISRIDQAYNIINDITNFKDKKECKRQVDEFVRKQGLSLDKPLYLIAYLIGSQE